MRAAAGMVYLATTLLVMGWVTAESLGLMTGPRPLRLAFTIALVGVIPGYGWLRALPIRDPIVTFVGATTSSLALSVLIAVVMAALDRWSPELAALSLGSIGLLGGGAWIARETLSEESAASP